MVEKIKILNLNYFIFHHICLFYCLFFPPVRLWCVSGASLVCLWCVSGVSACIRLCDESNNAAVLFHSHSTATNKMDSKAESQDASQHIVMMLFDHILVVPMAGNARKSDVERVESATAITKWLEKVTGTMRDKSGVKAEVMWDRFTTLYVEKKSNSCTELLLSNALNKFEHKDMVYTINQLVELMYRLKLVACEAVVNSSVLNYLVPYIYLMERSCDDSKNALDLTLAASKMCDILTFSSGNALERLICHYRLDSVFLWSWYKHEDIRVRTHALSATTGITAEGGAYVLRYFSDHQLRKHLIQESAKMSKVATAKRKDLTDTERHYCVELVELTLTLFVLHNDGVAKLNAKPNVYRPILDLALALLQFVDVPTTHHHSLKSKEVDAALVKHSATFVKVSDGHRMDSAFCLLAFALDKLAWPLDVQKELATPAVMHLATRIICSNVRRFGLVRGAFRIMGAATSSHALSQHTLMPTRLSKSNLLVRTRDWIDMMVRARQDPLMLSAEQARDQVEIFHRIFFFLSNAIVVDCDSVIKSGVLDSALAFMPFVDNRQDIYDSFINSLSNLLIQGEGRNLGFQHCTRLLLMNSQAREKGRHGSIGHTRPPSRCSIIPKRRETITDHLGNVCRGVFSNSGSGRVLSKLARLLRVLLSHLQLGRQDRTVDEGLP